MIELKNISIVYPGKKESFVALHPTTLSFAKGQFTVLLGRSGAGKSSLLRSINFLNQPSGGSVCVDSIGEITSGSRLRALRRCCGMIFQQHQLLPRSTVLRNVLNGRLAYHSFFRSIFPLPVRERLLALECLDRVGLFDKALNRADQLSGGEQQRVGIARALAQQSSIMLADEPVASLDPATSVTLLRLLKRICSEDGITAVVSLHQVDLARSFADRIVGLAAGRVIFDGTPAQLDDTALGRIYGESHVADMSSSVPNEAGYESKWPAFANPSPTFSQT